MAGIETKRFDAPDETRPFERNGGPGDVFSIAPGHDAEVVGDE